MTEIIEQVQVEIRCAATVEGDLWRWPFFGGRCTRMGRATIVATRERGDLVLYPIGWATDTNDGQVVVACPDHTVPTVGRSEK